jgi:CubicO group peptidase (beta-lactamase class C family)
MTFEAMPAAVAGSFAAGFEPVAEELGRLATEHPWFSAQFCAYLNGRPIVDLWAGPDATADRIQGVFSATKGMAGICIALLLEREQLDLDAPVSSYWPEFAHAGKGGITVRTALSHQAGIIGVEPQVGLDVLLDHPEMARRVAAQAPYWRPGQGMGYHALTIGTIIDELVRRVVGAPVAEFFAREITMLRMIDAFIAVPEGDEARVDDVLPAYPDGMDTPVNPVMTPGEGQSLTGAAFNADAFDPFDPPVANIRAARAAGHAAVGGAANARGLARLYASLTHTVDGHAPLLSNDTVAAVSQMQVAAMDLVLGLPNRYAIVFQKSDQRLAYGSHRAFGHDGAGGGFGINDPAYGLAFGYVPRRMSDPGGADARGLALAAVVRRIVADSGALRS